MSWIIIITYVFFLSFITLLGLIKGFLLFLLFYKKKISKKKISEGKSQEENPVTKKVTDYPMITIQLPIYNEYYMVERLLSSVSQINWPKEKLEIQILDDSDDETSDLISQTLKETKFSPFKIQHLKRKRREGFKAGALQAGFQQSEGEFIAIFDADFLLDEDFLHKTIPLFSDEKLGAVQTKWGHINENYSWLTKAQALSLDVHFNIEQFSKSEFNHFINFNGTAGVFRRKCLLSVGGWNNDVLTEDLDLSYRAQLKGWKFKYFPGSVSPAELPITVGALRSQQHRWAKGGAQCARKYCARIIKHKNLPWLTKMLALFHLLSSFVFVSIVGLIFLSIPLLLALELNPTGVSFIASLKAFFLISLAAVCFYCLFAMKKKCENPWKVLATFAFFFPFYISINMNIALYNAIGVIEGYLGRKSPFVRTPKFKVGNEKNQGKPWKNNKYLRKKAEKWLWLDFLVALYLLSAALLAFHYKNTSMLIFLASALIGFTYVFGFSLKQRHWSWPWLSRKRS